jgi:hypothetical protein
LLLQLQLLLLLELLPIRNQKCLIKSSQRIKTIIDPRIPETNALSAPPITDPSMTIQIASVNFAFSEPTKNTQTG